MKLKEILPLLTRNDKKKLILLLFFSIILALIEAVGLSSIMPFIDISMDFSKLQSNDYYRQIFTFLNFETERDFAIAFGFSLLVFYLFRAVIILVYTYALSLFKAQLVARLKRQLFDHYLGMRYRDYVTHNHSVMSKVIHTNATQVGVFIHALFTVGTELFVVLFLYVLMLITNWKITVVFTMVIIIKLLSLVRPISIKIKKIGVEKEIIVLKLFELLNRSFGNFRYLKLQSIDCVNQLKKQLFLITQEDSKIDAYHQYFMVMPRLFLETLGFSMVVLLLIYLLYQQPHNLAYILPTLSLFVLAMYRLLPSINRIISSYNTMLYSQQGAYLFTQAMTFDRENIGTQTVTFTDNIQLSNIAFHYHDGIPVLKDVNLTIKKGERIAFVGASGAGKSTLVDLIIGLHQAENGQLKIDGQLINEDNIQSWRAQIGYIPQQIYLFDGTVADNVCFGKAFDEAKLIAVLKQANIFDFLQQKSGISTVVGENGIQLSGGQKQRVAIARALYGNPEVLVLDEATSALDDKVEQKIMNEIYDISSDKTLIIIAHRLGTTKNCDKIYTISDGSIVPQPQS